MDVKIKSEEGVFKYRVNGLVLHNDKVLTVDIADNGFFCLPGGHVHLGEDSFEAVRREVKEETGIEADKVSLFAIIENFFPGKNNCKMHEVGVYYLVEAKDLKGRDKDFELIENDEGKLVKLNFKWISLDEIEEANFRPDKLKTKLKKRDFSFEHFIVKDI